MPRSTPRPRVKTVARGYGARHKAQRAADKRLVDAGRAHCWRCGGWIPPDTRWDLGHDDFDRTVYRGPEHVICNRRAPRLKQLRRRTL